MEWLEIISQWFQNITYIFQWYWGDVLYNVGFCFYIGFFYFFFSLLLSSSFQKIGATDVILHHANHGGLKEYVFRQQDCFAKLLKEEKWQKEILVPFWAFSWGILSSCFSWVRVLYQRGLHLQRFTFTRCLRRQWHPTPVLLPRKSHGWRSLEGYSPWGR